MRALSKRSVKSLELASPRPSHLFLTIRENIYLVDRIACDPTTATRAFRLNKSDGTLYDVAQTSFGPQCDCPDFVYRRDGLDPEGCKHVRALVDHGLIDARSPGRGVPGVVDLPSAGS